MADCIWLGTVSSVPTLAGNWSTAAVPAAGDDVIFPYDATVNVDGGAIVADIGSLTVEEGCAISIGTSAAVPLTFVGDDAATVVNDNGRGVRYLSGQDTVQWNVRGKGTVYVDGRFNDELNIDADGATVVVGPIRATPAEFDVIGTIAAGNLVRLVAVTTQAAGAVPINAIFGAKIYTESSLTTVFQYGGTLYVRGAAGLTNWYGSAGALHYEGAGTPIAILSVRASAQAIFDGDFRAVTVTAASLYSGGTIRDSYGRITWTGGVHLVECSLSNVTLDVGPNREYAPVDL